MKITRLAGALGAEIHDLRLDQASSDEVGALYAAFLEHGVVVVRNQSLDSAAYMRFARAVGQPIPYPFVRGIEGFPEIIEVKKLENETVNFGGVWHSDTTYLPCPPKGTMLLARTLPAFGGDTLFANQTAAWEALSPPMQRLLDGLVAVSSSAKADISKTREDRIREDGSKSAPETYMAVHPVVRTHPETGRRALYVNEAHTAEIRGLGPGESDALLPFLFRHQVRPEFTCRVRWEPGSLAFWDNRCVMHNPVNDYHGQRRILHRITLAGDVPR